MLLKINASVTDFPIFTPLETFFKEYKAAGVDGVELTTGVKSRWRWEYLVRLSSYYDLPIVSFHQSIWSGVGMYFDERVIEKAKKLGVTVFAFHPPTLCRIDSKRMHRYLARLSKMQKKYAITICFENMKNERIYKQLYHGDKTVTDHLWDIYSLANTYNLQLTYDTSHARFSNPPQNPIFEKIFPKIGNIHLSSFHGKREHLSLAKGDFDTKSFLSYLIQKNYQGILTLEVRKPVRKLVIVPFDFVAVRESVTLVKQIFDKSLSSRSGK